MDYYQGVVAEYLDANRAVFLNTECFIQLDPGSDTPKGTTWYCDIVAVNLRESKVYLCEVTFSRDLSGLLKRLKTWDENWPRVCAALQRDCSIPADWPIQPWVFIPAERWQILQSKHQSDNMPVPRVTYLESVVPWTYSSDSRTEDAIDQNA